MGFGGHHQPAHREREADPQQDAQTRGHHRLRKHDSVKHSIASTNRLQDAVLPAPLDGRRVDYEADHERSDDERGGYHEEDYLVEDAGHDLLIVGDDLALEQDVGAGKALQTRDQLRGIRSRFRCYEHETGCTRRESKRFDEGF